MLPEVVSTARYRMPDWLKTCFWSCCNALPLSNQLLISCIFRPLTCADAPTASNPPQGLSASRTSCPIEPGESYDLLRLPGDEDACLGAIYFSRTSS
jgi:hypothetical protein